MRLPSKLIDIMARIKIGLRSLLAILLVAVTTLAIAQPYPIKPIKLLVGVPPGGSSDAIARIFAAWLQEELGQPAVVDNRPGANTAIAAYAVVHAAPDGYTLLVASDAFITVPLLTKLQYDPFKDFTPIGTLTVSPFVFAVHPSSPINSAKELVEYAKAHPDEINYGSSGNGGASHLGAEKFKLLTGTKMVHVPYRGAGPALTDAIGGQVQLSLWTPLAITPHVKAGKLKALAVTGTKRVPSLPQVPTFAEAGFPQYDHKTWIGVYAPTGTPKPILDKVSAEINKMLAAPKIKQKLQENGAEPFVSTPEQFTQMMRSDTDELRGLIKAANVKMD